MYIAAEVFKICLTLWKDTILQLCSNFLFTKNLNNPEERLQINQLKVEVKTQAEKNSWQYISTALSESVYRAINYDAGNDSESFTRKVWFSWRRHLEGCRNLSRRIIRLVSTRRAKSIVNLSIAVKLFNLDCLSR